ncbi:hypothetical protein HDU85_006262 [Gaertneriomyces sp. JEL0708]|nr:hypothetical protein HDU85_006262 [Gaertneriomyces sp. JEL0708]
MHLKWTTAALAFAALSRQSLAAPTFSDARENKTVFEFPGLTDGPIYYDGQVPVLPSDDAESISPIEYVTFLDQAASRQDKSNAWTLPFNGVVYVKLPDPNPVLDLILGAKGAMIKGVITALYKLAVSQEVRDRLAERLGWFYVAGVPFRTVGVDLPASTSVGGKHEIKLNRASISGEFDTLVNAVVNDEFEADRKIDYSASVWDLIDSRVLPGSTYMVEPAGTTIISDIDDTIKISEVNDIAKLARNTFLEAYKPVEGMSAVYNNLKAKFAAKKENAYFTYLSGSPWNLYPGLSSFVRDFKFPMGQFILKDFNVLDGSALDFIFRRLENYKRDAILAYIARFPDHKFVMIGDSTELDPEIYGEIARQFPDKIRCIAIRKVEGVNGEKEAQNNANARFQKAFEGVSASQWMTFSASNQIPLDNIVNAGSCAAYELPAVYKPSTLIGVPGVKPGSPAVY